MKNIMAYQQMINANPHKPQTQAFLSPTQLAQLGILGMSPNVQQVTQQQFVQAQKVLNTQPASQQNNGAAGALQKRKGSTKTQQQ